MRTTRVVRGRAGIGALVIGMLTACASTPRPATRNGATVSGAEVDGGNVADLQRRLDEVEPGGADYAEARRRVCTYLATRGLELANAGNHAGAVQHLRDALVHFSPAELAAGHLPRALLPLAEKVLAWASPRGDEVNALAASRVMMAVEGAPAEGRETFERIRDWGQRNRTEFQRSWVAEGSQAEVWSGVARIVPATDVLEIASEHLIQRRRAAMEGVSMLRREGAPRPTYDEARQLRAGLNASGAELAILYLRVGDVRGAANRLRQFGPGNESANLADVLGSIAQGEGGADPMAELAALLERLEVGRAEGEGGRRAAAMLPRERLEGAAAGVCRNGRRMFPTDARFAECLGSAAFRARDLGLTSAHFESAWRLSRDTQPALRRAIETSALWLQSEIGDDDIRGGQRAYQRAHELVDEWTTRYQGQVSPVSEADLEQIAAQLSLSGGDLQEATNHLQRASRATPASREAFYILAEVAWRKHDAPTATRLLNEGLALPLRPSETERLFRQRFNVRLAQVTATSGDAAGATRRFEEAATALDALARSASNEELAVVLYERAIVADALGDNAHVRDHLNASIDAAPDAREINAKAVAFCLSRGRWADARDLARQARAQLTLDRPWQVYFALWGMAAAQAGHLNDDGGARAALERLAEGAGESATWTIRIAQRFTGAIDAAAFAGYARTRGQQAEMHFYEGLLKLGANDVAGAEAAFRATLATDVTPYFEYEMAWEMLERHVRPTATSPATTTSAATPAATTTTPTASR